MPLGVVVSLHRRTRFPRPLHASLVRSVASRGALSDAAGSSAHPSRHRSCSRCGCHLVTNLLRHVLRDRPRSASGGMTSFSPAVRGEHLLLHPTDRQHASLQCDRHPLWRRSASRCVREQAASAVVIVTPRTVRPWVRPPRHVNVSASARLRDDAQVMRVPRTYDSAICADSFITSPSCPVSVNPGSSVHRGRFDEQHVATGFR